MTLGRCHPECRSSACSRRSWNWWHSLPELSARSFTEMLLPQWVLVPTSSVWLLSLPVPLCFQQDALVCGLSKALQQCQRDNSSLFSQNQTDLRLQNAFWSICLYQGSCSSYGSQPKYLPITLASVSSAGIASSSVVFRDQPCLT